MRFTKLAASLLTLALWVATFTACQQNDQEPTPSAPTEPASAEITPATPAAPPAGNASAANGAKTATAPPFHQPQTPAANANLVPQRPLTMPIARSQWGELTIQDVQDYARITRERQVAELVPFDKVGMLPNQTLRELAEKVTTREAALNELAKSTDPELISFCTKDFNTDYENLVLSLIEKTLVLDKLTTPTQEAVQQFYDANPAQFKQEFAFSMRFLLLTTYRPYTVRKGDTIESIANAISGDPAQAANIRADVDTRPRRFEKGVVNKELTPGEKLLVPMNEQESQQVRQRLEDLLKKLDAGAEGVTFEQLTRDYSDSGFKNQIVGPLPMGTRPMAAALIENGRKTPVGELSPIFRTSHGWQVIQVIEKREEGMRPLSEVRHLIIDQLKEMKHAEMVDAMWADLLKHPQLTIHYDLLAKGDALTTGTVVASLGEKQIVWNDMLGSWKSEERPTEPEKVKKWADNSDPIRIALAVDWARPFMTDMSNNIARQMEMIRRAKVGSLYLSRQATERALGRITPPMIQEYYAANQDKFMYPERITYQTMIMPLAAKDAQLTGPELQAALDALKTKMRASLQRVDSPEAFVNQAALVNEALMSKGIEAMHANEPVDIDSITDPILKEQIEPLQSGQWSQPFVMNGTVTAVLVVKRLPPEVKPQELVIGQIKKELFDRIVADAMLEVEKEKLKQSNFEFLL